MKILWLTNIPSPYRVDFFNELGKYCDLTVLFEKKTSAERDDSWAKFNINNFKAIFLKGKSIGVAEALCFEVMKYINNSYDHIVVTNFSDPTGIIAIIYMKLKGISYEIESDGGFVGTGKGLKEMFKKWLLSGAKLYFSTAEEHDNYYLTYGAKSDQIVRYPFTSLFEKDILEHPVDEKIKENLRKELQINEEEVILAVGQFIYRKGFDVLIKAASLLPSKVGIYIVGGEPTEEYLQLRKKYNLKNVHFCGFMKTQELEKYYILADIFVHPTREDIWGLVINEAMAKGLPVITTNRCVAGLELITDDSIGQIIPVGDAHKLALAISKQIETISNERSNLVLNRIKEFTVEQMAQVHLKAFINTKS
ncbi:glycosyltransferase family 4 protein [Thomasclavelia spiroformis]|uniref:glycosyltransferase family 4 protein n=1 Tax=Thomasclavelia spiroformis TaxID=29348 RepID=UPI00255C05D6|nr:glycosyltransferase family 4 protein [Thomasclavelia spiroformis]